MISIRQQFRLRRVVGLAVALTCLGVSRAEAGGLFKHHKAAGTQAAVFAVPAAASGYTLAPASSQALTFAAPAATTYSLMPSTYSLVNTQAATFTAPASSYVLLPSSANAQLFVLGSGGVATSQIASSQVATASAESLAMADQYSLLGGIFQNRQLIGQVVDLIRRGIAGGTTNKGSLLELALNLVRQVVAPTTGDVGNLANVIEDLLRKSGVVSNPPPANDTPIDFGGDGDVTLEVPAYSIKVKRSGGSTTPATPGGGDTPPKSIDPADLRAAAPLGAQGSDLADRLNQAITNLEAATQQLKGAAESLKQVKPSGQH